MDQGRPFRQDPILEIGVESLARPRRDTKPSAKVAEASSWDWGWFAAIWVVTVYFSTPACWAFTIWLLQNEPALRLPIIG